MNTTKFFSRSLNRGLHCRTKRWYSVQRLVAVAIVLGTFLSLSVLFFYSVLIYHCCTRTSDVIVSLTTTSNRFQYELPLTVHSLLSQTVLPKEIRIYLSSAKLMINQTNVTIAYLKRSLVRLDSSTAVVTLFDRLVKIQLEEEDYGPATKFLPILREFHGMATSQAQSQLIMVCDDDHYYHPHTIGTLYDYASDYKTSIIGLRGWRSKSETLTQPRHPFLPLFQYVRTLPGVFPVTRKLPCTSSNHFVYRMHIAWALSRPTTRICFVRRSSTRRSTSTTIRHRTMFVAWTTSGSTGTHPNATSPVG